MRRIKLRNDVAKYARPYALAELSVRRSWLDRAGSEDSVVAAVLDDVSSAMLPPRSDNVKHTP
jgi:hypothetical protein